MKGISRRTIFIVLFLLFALGSSFFVWRIIIQKNNITNLNSQKGSTIIALGDSITNGYGIGREYAYPAILERELGIPVINMGVDGDTTDSARDRLERDVLAKDPWIVIVFLGGNDFLKRFSRETTTANLSYIIERIHEIGAVVALVEPGVPGFLGSPQAGVYEELAKKYKTLLVRDTIGGILGNEALMHDPIHPNQEGQEVIAARILRIMKPVVEHME